MYTRLPAGPYTSTVYAAIDFETYSEVGYYFDDVANKWRSITDSAPHGLGAVGSRVYSEHLSTEILSLAYDLKDGNGPQLWMPDLNPPQPLFDYLAFGGIIEAWNVAFERDIWKNVCVSHLKWPPWPVEQSRDTMSKSYAHSLPGALAKTGAALNTTIRKQTDGGRLLRKFSVPSNPLKLNPTRRRILPKDDPPDAARLYGYNIDDIRSQAEISAHIPDLSPKELDVWFLDRRINERGVHIDRGALNNCLEIVRQATERYIIELQTITQDAVKSINEIQKIRTWFSENDVSLPNLQIETVVDALDRDDLPPPVRRVLEIRQILGSQSVKKLYAIDRRIADDGRLHGLFVFCGADRTGRFAGRGPQPQNLPAFGPVRSWGHKEAIRALETISCRDLDLVECQFGNAVKTVSGCLRALFSAAPGHELICSDYSAIEAVVIAELAGEQWRREVFRTHSKIYETSASKITGVPFEEFLEHKKRTGEHHPMRQKIGKYAELASGYGGWIGAWKNFGADEHLTDDEIKKAILKWRADSPNIVEFWGGQLRKNPHAWEFTEEYYGLEGAAISAILNPGTCYNYRRITYGVKDDVLYCQLPSGRNLTYHKPRLAVVDDRYSKLPIYQISYMGHNSNHKTGPIGWIRLSTYGGKLAENVTQATARDILVSAMINIERAGYPIVLHVHDEIVSEVSTGCGSIKEFETIMSAMPSWCPDWPVFARGGWRGQHYRKD